MFEGVYFQFPKLAFLLFFFLACEALCPLRSNPLYFPRPVLFGEVGVKPPIWLWIAKWAMIAFLVIALMSPVRDREAARHERGWDILLIVDPLLTDTAAIPQIISFMNRRMDERIALWIPENTIVPLTYEYKALISILKQVPLPESSGEATLNISRFFATSQEGHKLAIVLSEHPESFLTTLPNGIQTATISPLKEPQWADTINRTYPSYKVQQSHRYFDYYYVYPLFLGFLAMLAYLYGRNQKGIR